jgi:glycosyltransferase involved in cell wall biosynthesis
VPRPFVSVLIDTYNHERFIEEAIVSVLEQDFPASDREIIVVDDGSTDRTPEIVRKFEPQVRLLRKTNGGQASAFNAGIRECKGEIISFLDGDDWWLAAKLSTVATALERNRDVGTVGHGLYEVSQSGGLPVLNIPNQAYKNFLRTTRDARDLIELLSFLGTSRLTVRREVLQRVLPVPDTLLADLYLAAVATAISGALILDQGLVNYRLHSGNAYQFRELDTARMQQKLEGLRSFSRQLPPKLHELGVPKEAIDELMAPTLLDSERLRLALGEGWPWETVRVERKAFLQRYDSASFGYYFFHLAILGAALILPPRLFYRAHHFYAEHRLRRVRNLIGRAEPAASLVIKKAAP